jgi:arsenite methyltransferase
MSADAIHAPTAPTSDDLLAQQAIKDTVRLAYREVVGKSTAQDAIERLYDPGQIALLPSGALAQALGVGNPVRAACLRHGETVVDLGSGGGIDVILAAHAVGPSGKAIGLDILPEMLETAARHAAEAGVTNVEWVQGEMETIPLPDEAADVVISNGAINLSPRKSRVFAEIFRVLRPGGRFVTSDNFVDDDLPPEVLTSPAAWAG